MTDRRALIVGSWLAKGRDQPSPQRVRSITGRWKAVFKEDRYGFRSLKNRRASPVVLSNPTMTQLIGALESPSKITNDSELLFYFVGHSASVGDNDIRLILGVNEQGEDRSCLLSLLLHTIYDQTSISKLIFVLDTCHAGRTKAIFHPIREDSFAMFGGGDAYAYNANFSDGLLRALELPIHKRDQRIDQRARGITYLKVFEDAQRRVITGVSSSEAKQKPECFGDRGGELLLKAPVSVPDGFNDFASVRSIYGRIFRLLEIINVSNPTFDALRKSVCRDPIFLLRRAPAGEDSYVSSERLNEYLDFLRAAHWIVQPKGRFEITSEGRDACNKESFNKALRNVIEAKIFPAEVTFDFLDELVRELLNDMIPPTPIRIKERAGMKGKLLELNVATRVAIQVLPSTGRFFKGAADAIYPSELGG